MMVKIVDNDDDDDDNDDNDHGPCVDKNPPQVCNGFTPACNVRPAAYLLSKDILPGNISGCLSMQQNK